MQSSVTTLLCKIITAYIFMQNSLVILLTLRMGPKISFNAVAFKSNFFYSVFSVENLGCLSWTANQQSQRQVLWRWGCPKRVQGQSKEGAKNPAQICAQWLLLRFGNLQGESVYFSHACSRYYLKRHFEGIYQQNFNRVVIQAITQLLVKSVALKDCIYSNLES